MSKVHSVYANDLDRCWYKSSNVIYSECDDTNSHLKTLRIVFKNGRRYEYYGVDVNDYVLFKNADTQGVAFTKYIRKYDCQRLDDVNVDDLLNELDSLLKEDNVKSPCE